MKILCLSLLLHVSLQLRCEKETITAHVGGEFILKCNYDTSRFRYYKKYWCRGDSRNICEILVEDVYKVRGRSHIIDAGRFGLFVKVTDLQFEDTGGYWVGIKTHQIYSDIMSKVNVVITEVPVSKPRLWPTRSLVARPTCWGLSVTVRCGCTKGSGVRYTWYQCTHHKDFRLLMSSDLHLNCSTVEKDSDYYCIASNDVSSQKSEILSVQVLVPADNNCIYVVNMQGQPVYDCADRMSTSVANTPPVTVTTCQDNVTIHTDTRNQSLQIDQDLCRSWTGLPLCYTLLRWFFFASLLIFLCIVLICTKKRQEKKRENYARGGRTLS